MAMKLLPKPTTICKDMGIIPKYPKISLSHDVHDRKLTIVFSPLHHLLTPKYINLMTITTWHIPFYHT